MLDRMYIKAMCRLHDMLDDEQGDTNFISVLIILGIVVILAGVFMGAQGAVVERVSVRTPYCKIH